MSDEKLPLRAEVGNPVVDRFWSKVSRTSNGGCWIWTASTDGHGYGQFEFNGRNQRAHRVSWALTHGVELESSVCLCHRCDNPLCVNPEHLFTGTKRDNTQDMLAKGRDGHGQMPGEVNPNAKLTEDDVQEIRRLRAAGVKLKDIAIQFSITESNVTRIAKRKGWKHVV